MADFQIIESQRSLPGTSTGVHGRPTTETGQGEVYRAMGNFGAALGDLGVKLYKVQGEAELTQKMFEANETFQKLHKDILTETDPEKYEQMFDEAWQKVESAEVKNGYARQRYQSALPALQKSQMSAMLSAYEGRIRENHEMAVSFAEAQAIRSGNTNALEKLLKSQVDMGYMTRDEAGLRITIVNDKVKQKLHMNSQQELSAFAYENPETVLSWKNADDMLKAFPNALSTDLTWIQGVAQNKLAIERRQNAINTSRYYGVVHDLAAKSIDQNIPPDQRPQTSDVLMQIQQLDLSPQQKTELVDEYNDAVKIWSQTGENLYGSRPTSKFAEIRQKVLDKQIRSELEIQEWTGKVDGYGLPQESYLLRLYNGDESSAKAFEDSDSAKLLKELFDDWGRTIYSPVAATILREKGYRLLQDAIDSSVKPMTDREKKEKSIRIFNSLITEPSTSVSIMPPAEMMESDLNKIPLAKLPKTEKKPTRDEFIQTVAKLKKQGKNKEARTYYDKWLGELWQ